MSFLTVEQASKFASEYAGKSVTASNIMYLIQYGRIDRAETDGGVLVDKDQLIAYYNSNKGKREREWNEQLGKELNWALSFDTYKEAETTKHVHRLHPYKGKFIPQLVEYFLDEHTDNFKRQVYFEKGDIVLDPFCGSGTTLVQCAEMNIHAVGIDVSMFNTQISNCKIRSYDLLKVERTVKYITGRLEAFEYRLGVENFENALLDELSAFNKEYFPSPEFKKLVYQKKVNEKQYGHEKEAEFLPTFYRLCKEYGISLDAAGDTFFDKWFFDTVRKELEFASSEIDKIEDDDIKSLLQVVLSRTMRSCRATTHSDLATLLEPVYCTYYCTKHKKICKPLFSILKWWRTYSADTVKRLAEFEALRTDSIQVCYNGDSREMNIAEKIERETPSLFPIYEKQKIKGIFCSPPYIGLIDYHEQHAYAYELFGLERHDDEEIGALSKGNTVQARNAYVQDICEVLVNCKKYLADDYEIFIVANDKYNLYPQIAERAGMYIAERFERPVLNRTEKDKQAYSETIFRMKEL
ncbi:MAG: site-specific DNA-methyltransferase [Clostridia bacterium]|nr:site-specific DNA-methyltransferase [Clostridia bacterium]